MGVYLLATSLVALLAVASAVRPPYWGGTPLTLGLAAAGIFLFVGFREDVGADWQRYRDIYYHISVIRPFSDGLSTDFGFYLLNWAAAASSIGFYGVTAFCAAALAWGLVSFAKQTAYPWVCLTIAMPHVVNVMAMDHIRQSTALGFSLLGMANLLRGRTLACIILLVVACSFHKSAVVLLPLVAAASNRSRMTTYLCSFGFVVAFYFLVLADTASVYEARYIRREYGARASTLRLLQNIPPALIYLAIWRRIGMRVEARYFWFLLSLCAFVLPLLLLVVPSSAAIDRLGKFIIPLQMFIYSQMLVLLTDGVLYRLFVVVLLCVYCLMYQGAWFHFSEIADEFWIPYGTILF